MEETDSQHEELFSMDDVKVEVMRSRGAGGQVSRSRLSYSLPHTWSSMSIKLSLLCVSPIYRAG